LNFFAPSRLVATKLKVGSVCDQFAVFEQNSLQCRYKRAFLQILRRRRRRLQNDLERTRLDTWRRAQNAVVTIADDAVAGAETVDDRPAVTGQELFGGKQRRF